MNLMMFTIATNTTRKLSPLLLQQLQATQTQWYSKKAGNSSSQRVKTPSEGKQQSKWVAKRRTLVGMDDATNSQNDKRFEGRQVVDPVWLFAEYKTQMFEIERAIEFHKELGQPSMFNNLGSSSEKNNSNNGSSSGGGILQVRLTLDMTTKKKTKFMDNVRGAVFFPNYFKDGFQKEVIAVCKDPAMIEECKKAGALMAGLPSEILKKFEKAEISDQAYDYLVCTPDCFADVMAIKKKIHRDKLPTPRAGTVTEDLADQVMRLHLSKEYESSKISDERAILKAKIGQLNFPTEQLTENLGALISKLIAHKRYAQETFISECVLYCAPSTEKFKVNLDRFTRPEQQEQQETEQEKQ